LTSQNLAGIHYAQSERAMIGIALSQSEFGILLIGKTNISYKQNHVR